MIEMILLAKEIRLRILEILYINLPNWTSDTIITELLARGEYQIDMPQIQGHLRYLAEKGYIEAKEASIDDLCLKRNLGKLTSKGTDFLEGFLPDDRGISRKNSAAYAGYPEMRGWILKALYTNLPEWTGDQLLAQILSQGAYRMTSSQAWGHCRYLAEKGFVDLQQASIEKLSMVRNLAKLNAKGVDFVEGNCPEEPGITRK
jgi:hypothetical protein